MNFEYKTVSIKEAEIEKQVLKKDEDTRGYRPDIIFYTDEDETIYVEITNSCGKTVNDYYEIWERLDKTVIEVKKYENCNISYMEMDEDDQFFHIYDETIFRFLYNPIMDKARREQLELMAELSDRKKEYEQNQYNKKCKQHIYDTLKKIKNYTMFFNNLTIVKEDKEYKYISADNFYKHKNYWFNLTYEDAIVNLKIPNIIANEFKYYDEINIKFGYKKII